MSLNIVIPMSGRGSRFSDAGFIFPKPLIDVKGKPMIARVIDNLKPLNREDYKFIFIVQKEHYEKYDLHNVLSSNVGDKEFEIVQVNGITQGAACSVLLGSDYFDNSDELIIANSDQLIESKSMDLWYQEIEKQKTTRDGLIMVAHNCHPKWSYAKVVDDKVVEVAEKRVISNFSTTGVYWYRRGQDFVSGASEMIKKDIRTNNEFYVAPVYNELILMGKNIGIAEIQPQDMIGLGDPESLNLYLTQKANEGGQ